MPREDDRRKQTYLCIYAVNNKQQSNYQRDSTNNTMKRVCNVTAAVVLSFFHQAPLHYKATTFPVLNVFCFSSAFNALSRMHAGPKSASAFIIVVPLAPSNLDLQHPYYSFDFFSTLKKNIEQMATSLSIFKS